MKPFLLIATRAEDDTADAEYEQFLRFGNLDESELVRLRLEQRPMPDINLDDFSGIIVGGSPFTGSDPDDQKSDTQKRVEQEISTLLDEVVVRDFPFLGACYGVGTLLSHQGAVIDSTYSEPVGAVMISLTEDGRQDPLLAEVPDTFGAFVGHKEACTVFPAHAVLLASSPTCPVQMFRLKNNLYGTQFHPELDAPGIATRIRTYKDFGYFEPDQADSLIAETSQWDVSDANRVVAAFTARYATR
ncbi:glutamine amidotransferase [Flaviflexus massiliensis]|uniref:glutamine amidotransferase n=1 Tax=Flaviflexus massiliensis TaxID=1522309 RepID=UPI0006D59E06|nr:glutamine amidotransferase [Flaviflexus massiliensis]